MRINKKNYKKKLRELDLSCYPSLPDFLLNVRTKLLKKEALSVSEELMSFPRFKKYINDTRETLNNLLVNTLDLDKFSHRPPKPYQLDGIKFLLRNDRCILADDMGVGKSIQAVLAALSLPHDYKILVVTLKTLKYNFEDEIEPYCDSYKVIEDKWEKGYKFTIVHYESLKKWLPNILKENFDCVIIDEAHQIKNPKIGRTKNIISIIKEVERVWLLTGTPMTSRPIDYYNLLKIINHDIASNWKFFVEKYCDATRDEYGAWETNGASNLSELHLKTKDKILRRLKTDVIKDLPNKERYSLKLKLKDKKKYENVINNYSSQKLNKLINENEEFDIFSEENYDVNEMTKYLLFRQFCALEKINDGSLFELIQSNIDEGNKIVVFTNFTAVVDEIKLKLNDVCVTLDGRIKDAKDRLSIVKEFNNNDTQKVLVCNLMVGSTGLNITSANVIIINDMYWVPGVMLQAEDRAWRIGQTREVSVIYPIYKGTVEEIVYEIINNKMKNITTVIDGEEKHYFKDGETNNEKVSAKVENKDSILAEIFAQMGS